MYKNKLFLVIILTLTCLQLSAVDYSYVSTKTLIVIYEDFLDGSMSAEITASDVTNTVEPAVEFFREFYWRNSHLKVNLEISYLTISTTMTFADLNSDMSLDPIRIRNDLNALFIDQDQYGAVIALYALPTDPGFGGLTWPVLDNIDGECTFVCIPSSKFDKLRDILVHEYNHSIDYLNDFNSLPAYPSNHIPDYVNDGNTGPYNCFFDLNAGIIRDWPISQWFSQPNFTWGVTRTTEDADNDGVPDYGSDGEGNPLAITEYSLGSSTSSGDTDNDGLSDLDEVMAHYYTSSNLNSANSDSDNIPDGIDPYPIYTTTTYCAKSTSVTIDGTINTNEHHIANYFYESTHIAYTFLDWDDTNLYVSISVISASGDFNDRAFFIYIDQNADGLIQGSDNNVIYAGPSGGSLSIRAWQLASAQWEQRASEYTSHGITGEMYQTSNSLTVELAIPATSPVGINLTHGKKFGIQLSYAAVAGSWSGDETRQDLLTQRYEDDIESLNIVLRDNPAGKDFKVQYQTYFGNDPSNQIGPVLNLINTGFDTIDIADCKIRYFYTCENPTTQQFNCDSIPLPRSTSQVTGTFVAQDSINYYLEIGFTSAAGTLLPGASTGTIQTRFNKTDWSDYTQSNDYSFNGSFQTLTDYDKVLVYYKGNLVWGTTP